MVNRKVKTLRGVTRVQIMIALSSPGDKSGGSVDSGRSVRERDDEEMGEDRRAICVAGAAIATAAAMSVCERVNVKKDKIMEEVPRGSAVTSTP